MARPTKQKEMKGKPAEGAEAPKEAGEKSASGNNMMANLVMPLLTALVVGVVSSVISGAAVYFITPIVMAPIIEKQLAVALGLEVPEEEAAAEGEEGAAEGEEGEAEEPTFGPVIDLDEFTVNLSDADKPRYLRAELSITITANDENFGKLEGEAAHKWEEEFHHEIAHFVPAIRDIVISSLTKHTAAELSTPEGKEAVKEEIKTKVDEAFHEEHQVISVNIENFIIQ